MKSLRTAAASRAARLALPGALVGSLSFLLAALAGPRIGPSDPQDGSGKADEGATAAPAREEVPSAAYRAYAEERIKREFRKGAHRVITDAELRDALGRFDQRARELPDEVAQELVSREHRNLEARADLETGGVLAFARNLAGGGAGPLEDLVATREAVDALFRRAHAETRVAVARPSELAARLAPGATLELPRGAFELDGLPRPQGSAFPADVTLAGAGIDTTLLVLAKPLDAGGPLERFALRDCTVVASGGRLFSQPKGAAVLRLERVRVVGFDEGANVSGLLRFGEALVLDARDCRFEGGFGAVPGSGALLDVPREALVARIEGCALSRMSLRIARHPRGTTLRFERCRLEEVLDDPLADSEGKRGIEWVECDVRRLEGARETLRRREVDELFPGWRESLVR